MGHPLLRWRFALGVTLIISIGIILCLVPGASLRLHFWLALSGAVLAAIISVLWILFSRRMIPLRRDRRVWGLVAISILLALLGHLCRLYGGYVFPTAGSVFMADLAIVLNYAFLCLALNMRSGKQSADRLTLITAWWDLLIILWTASVIVYHVKLPGIASWYNLPLLANVDGFAYPLLGVSILCIITMMLYRAVPRPLHWPRGLLALGVVCVLGSDLWATYATSSGVSCASPFFSLVWILGVLCYGMAAILEATYYQQRSLRTRAIEPFPSVATLIVPILFILTALATTIFHAGDEDAAHGLGLIFGANGQAFAILVTLILVRQIVSFESHRRLNANLQELYNEMAQHAATDPLTGLANHRYFMERLQKEMRRATRYQRPVALVFCDLDHFKQINDSYGHVVGDTVLQEMAGCLQRAVREMDLVARYGGEEFVVLLPETTLEQAKTLAERLRLAIEGVALPQRNDQTVRLSMSCGIAAYPDTSASLETLLSHADHAMYQAKRAGRNRVIVAPQRTAGPVSF